MIFNFHQPLSLLKFRLFIGSSSILNSLASFLWSMTLAIFVSKFRNMFANIIKWMNVICGIILIFYRFKLFYSFIQIIVIHRVNA